MAYPVEKVGLKTYGITSNVFSKFKESYFCFSDFNLNIYKRLYVTYGFS